MIILIYEQWKLITNDIVPGVQPWYYISNFGEIYSTFSNKKLKLSKQEKTGYYIVSLRLINGGYKTFLIHRLVLMTFIPINNPELYEGNHKDGNKANNSIENLEWSTRQENIDHAWKHHLYKSGEDHHNSIYTNDQIHQICKGLEQGLPYKTIAENIGIEFNSKVSTLMSEIKNGNYWIEISSQYNFPEERSFQLFSNDEIHTICKYFEQGKSTDDILFLFGIEDPIEKQKKRVSINSIRRRDKFKNISKDYNF